MSSRVTFPRDWRDHLARAVNERDLTRIEALIEEGHTHNHTKHNDPLISDAAFLLGLAQDQSAAHHHHHHHQHQRATPTATATKSTLANSATGGSMSWVAQPIASLTQAAGSSHHANPAGRPQFTLRERVSHLREMALFPDSHPAAAYQHQQQNLNSSGGGGSRSVSTASNSYSHISSSVRRAFVPTPAGVSVTRGAEEAAAAMGVPASWIEPPTSLDESQYQHNVNVSAAASLQASPQRGASRSTTASPSRCSHPSFADNDDMSAALRLHSFIHAEERPAVKSSRLFGAYVSAERSAPRQYGDEEDDVVEQQQQQHQPQQQQQPEATVPGVEVSVSPERSISRSPSGGRRAAGAAAGRGGSPYHGSPEHQRMVRKLNAAAVAPEGAEVQHLLRFLSATEAMTRGSLEQTELSLRSGSGLLPHNALAASRYGVMYSRGISADVPKKEPAVVFLDN